MRRSKFFVALAALTLFALAPPRTHAQQEEEEQPLQEVFQAETVYPQDKGETQLTFTTRFRKDDDGARLTEPTFGAEYGLTDAWQVSVEVNALARRDPLSGATAFGVSDVRVGTKYSFMHMRGSNFHSAVGFEVGFPTGDVNRKLSEGFIEYEPFAILAKDFPHLNRLQVFTQVGFEFVQRVKTPDDPDEVEPAAHEFFWHSGFFFAVRRLRFTSEFSWETNTWNHGGDESHKHFTPGVVWKLPGTWEVGVGAPVQLEEGPGRFGAILKAVYEFGGGG